MMTLRQIYEGVLTERNKVQAPSLLLEDFNYYVNKAYNQYINKWYAPYDITQQTSDNLLVNKKKASFEVKDSESKFELPDDYLHLLSCICEFKSQSPRCKDANNLSIGATKLVSDILPQIINNAYYKPSYKKPYYSLWSEEITEPIENIENRVDTSDDETTNPLMKVLLDNGSDLPQSKTTLKNFIEINYGDNKKYNLARVNIEYIRTPLKLELSLTLLDTIEDTSQTMVCSDNVCYEIINELTHLIMEHDGDSARLQTHIPVSMSIVNPAQALTQTAQ